MPRKFFRKLLPSHESVRNHRYIARFGPWLQHHNLWHLHRRSVAGGIAVGLFAGLIPGSNPVQFAAAALLAIAFRVNLPLAAFVTLYSNPFTIVPLYVVAFRVVAVEVEPAALVARARAFDDERGDERDVAELDEIRRHEEVPVVVVNLGLE